jgi:hypothetical protein
MNAPFVLTGIALLKGLLIAGLSTVAYWLWRLGQRDAV